MSLTTPIVVTYAAVPTDCHRVSSEPNSSVYQSADGNLKLTVSHQATKTRVRHMAKLERRVVAADPLTAENTYQSAGVHIVIDEPQFGYSDVDLDNQVDSLIAFLTAANIAAICASRH